MKGWISSVQLNGWIEILSILFEPSKRSHEKKKMSKFLISRKLREDRLKKGKHTEMWKASRVKYKEEAFLMDLDTWK